MMSFKDRLRRALYHQPLDHLPTQISYTAGMGERLAAHFGVALNELPGFLGNHFLRVDLSFPRRSSRDGRILYDWWGVGHDAREEGYRIIESPLADDTDLDAYPWPDPQAPGLMEQAERTLHDFGREYFILPNLGWALFERAWSLRGFEQFLIDMAADAGFVTELLDRILEIQLVLIQRYLDLGVDGGYFGDDYGAQKGLLFSPHMWRSWIKPRLKRLFEPFLARSLPVILHSDGQIQPILPDLHEIGLTAINPVQPEVLDHAWLRQNFSGKLAFFGGISTQTVLPFGRPQEVIEAVHRCARTLAPGGSGLLLGPSHRLMTDIPLSNVEALLSAFREIEQFDNQELAPDQPISQPVPNSEDGLPAF
jgi:uroporphyrinogen decarboxylase